MSIPHRISTTPGGSTKPCVPIWITDIAVSEKSTAVYRKSANPGIIVSLTAVDRNVGCLSVSGVARKNTNARARVVWPSVSRQRARDRNISPGC